MGAGIPPRFGRAGTLLTLVGVFCVGALCLRPARGMAQTPALPVAGLVARYALDGSALDSSGTGNHGTLVGRANTVPGPVGRALYFDGSAYIEAATTGMPSGGGDRSIALWVRPDEVPSSEALLAGYGQLGAAGGAFLLGATHRESQLLASVSLWGEGIACASCASTPATTPLVPGRWCHVAVTRAGDRTTLYLDGVPTQRATLSANTAAGTSFYLAGLPAGWGGPGRLKGALDEVRVYRRALAAAEVQQLFAAGQVPDSTATRTGNPALVVSALEMQVDGAARDTSFSLANGDAGTLRWVVSEDTDWLYVRGPRGNGHTDSGSISGSGPGSLSLHTSGAGLPPGLYRGTVRVESNGGSVDIVVLMQVASSSATPPDGGAPAGSWSSPFAVPVEDVLSVPLRQVLAALSAQAKITLTGVRVVAVTRNRVIYVASEGPDASNPFYGSALMSQVWTSADGGTTWHLLVTSQPHRACNYDVHCRAAALHPDGQRVFLGFSEALYLDGTPLPRPSSVTGATALHVSADGQYLFVASQDLMGPCDYLTVAGGTWRISTAGLYRARLDSELSWERLPAPRVGSDPPVSLLGSDPADNAVVYYGNGQGVYRFVQPTAQSQGWRLVGSQSVPAYVTRHDTVRSPLNALRIPSSYVNGWTPHEGGDLRYSWDGYLFADQAVVYSRWSAYHSQVTFVSVLGSRDAGLSWAGGNVSEPPFVDARGSLGFISQSVTGQPGPGIATGRWNVDPLDPLTMYTTLAGLDLVYRSYDHGATWAPLGQGLPMSPAISGLGLDSLGTLYVQARTDSVWARQVARRVARVGAVTVTPFAGIGDTVRVTARIDSWPDRTAALPLALQVMALPDLGPFAAPDVAVALHDDGVAPDSLAQDRLWSGQVRVEEGRRLGTHGLIVAAALPDSPATRASYRVNYQVVPRGVRPVFTDSLLAGWSCQPAAAGLLSTQRASHGAASLRVEGQVTCTWSGPPLEPYCRELRFWAFSEAGVPALGINDLTGRGVAPKIPAGQWVKVAVPVEALAAGPAGDWYHPQVPLLTTLRFTASAPVWLDNITLWSPLPDPPSPGPTAVADDATGARPRAPRLLPPYPNPFNASTAIRYELAQGGDVKLDVYAVTGQWVCQLVSANQPAGPHLVVWDGRDAAGTPVGSGVYLAVLRLGDHRAITRMALLR